MSQLSNPSIEVVSGVTVEVRFPGPQGPQGPQGPPGTGGGGDIATDLIWDAKGDLAVGTGSDAAQRLAVGTVNDQVLVVDSATTTGLKWKQLAAGDLADFSTAVEAELIANLPTDANGALDIAQESTLQTALLALDDKADDNHDHGNLNNDGTIGTTAGLPVVTGTGGAIDTLSLGTAGQVLKVNSGATGVEFGTVSGTGSVATDTLWDAKGDLAVGTGADTASRLAVGSNGQVLTADST
jgi:hypothetical protein